MRIKLRHVLALLILLVYMVGTSADVARLRERVAHLESCAGLTGAQWSECRDYE